MISCVIWSILPTRLSLYPQPLLSLSLDTHLDCSSAVFSNDKLENRSQERTLSTDLDPVTFQRKFRDCLRKLVLRLAYETCQQRSWRRYCSSRLHADFPNCKEWAEGLLRLCFLQLERQRGFRNVLLQSETLKTLDTSNPRARKTFRTCQGVQRVKDSNVSTTWTRQVPA